MVVVSNSQKVGQLRVSRNRLTGHGANATGLDLKRTVVSVRLGMLWVLAERCLMPKLQNDVIDKLGCPDPFYASVGHLYSTRQVVLYVDGVYGESGVKKPLARYCLRSMLGFLDTYRRIIVADPDPEGATVQSSRELLERFMGKGMGVDMAAIVFLLEPTTRVDSCLDRRPYGTPRISTSRKSTELTHHLQSGQKFLY